MCYIQFSESMSQTTDKQRDSIKLLIGDLFGKVTTSEMDLFHIYRRLDYFWRS